ncbi:MAG TPA: hypothetical protein VMI54_16215 [Polyangiaceae bacterium]|nr:hypothetical protein [Polyangiaceae bacterium]
MSRLSGRFLCLGCRAAVFAAVFALGLAPARRARATPAALVGAGPESVALAGGGASLPLGPEAVLVNPAGLALLSRKTLLFGLRATELSLAVTSHGASSPFPAELSKGLDIGVAAPLVAPKLDGWHAALGLFAETPPDFLVRAHLPLAEVPSFPLLVGRTGSLDLGIGLGVGYGPVALGAGVEVLAELSGRDAVAGASGTPSGIGDELLPAWGPSLGANVDLGAWGRLGLAFHGVLRADFDVNVAQTTLAGVIDIVPLNVQGIAHYEPLKLDAEYSKTLGAWTVLAGARYEHWSAFPGWLGATVACPPGVACGTSPPPPPDYSDIVVPRLGVERSFETETLGFTARAGYSFVPTPVPEQRGSANELDAARHALGLGYRVHLTRGLPLELDGALRLDFLVPRTNHKAGDAADGPLGAEVTPHGTLVTWAFSARIAL